MNDFILYHGELVGFALITLLVIWAIIMFFVFKHHFAKKKEAMESTEKLENPEKEMDLANPESDTPPKGSILEAALDFFEPKSEPEPTTA